MRKVGSGVVLQGAYEPALFKDMVAEIDALGFDNLWMTDSSLHARNAYAYLTLAATVSPRLDVGTAVTNPLTRHPAITAAAAATVDEISGGRMILGIGAGDRPLLALGMKPASVDTLRASIEAIRALWSGEHVNVDDAAFTLRDAHLRFPARADIPIYISASGPRTLELAGEIADGVILLVGLFPEALAWAVDHVDRGASKAGRDGPHMAVFAYGAIDVDEERALESARSIAAWFPQTAPVICELAGLPAQLIDEVKARYAGGEFQEAAAAARLLPDDFVRRVALAGNADRARERIQAVVDAGADSVNVFPLGKGRMQTVHAFAACFDDLMRSGRAS
jgi:5,10-methylenetetrahydromethanopterin reductase